ncbi:MAG: dynamin family protein [Betaproteobacteria bacterium]|nr:dynamin family protein [Betaproteobacteria bacterium]
MKNAPVDVNAKILNQFESEIARYNHWREDLSRSVNEYHDWLERTNQLDVQQSVRFYDLLETLKKGRLLLAFLAEFSRGKSELINALFFSSFKERLLPSDVGRTTMCPTEIFHDPNEEPCLKLLSVETRYRDESISQLKNMPVEWSKIRLNIDDPASMRQALSALADTKRVYALDARMMGLIPMFDDNNGPKEDDIVEVPAWRYAMINYPHPLLTNGLAVLDTPGLNALGLEPELTLSTVPSAHAVLFLLSMDTGVTKSDLDIWERYVKSGLPAKIAVLNKIDLMWDDLKSPTEITAAIHRMTETTSQSLGLSQEKIFAVSAQKALVGRIKEDRQMVVRSGIESLEAYLATEVVPIRRQLLARAVTNEIGAMMLTSQRSCEQKLAANQAEFNELNQLAGKSRELILELWKKVSAEKEAYMLALAAYKSQRNVFSQKRTALVNKMNPAKIDLICSRSLEAINDAWMTVGLMRGMRQLIKLINTEFSEVSAAGEEVLHLMEDVYNTFHERFHFAKMEMPQLDFEGPHNRLQLLVYETEQFCKDPINIATPKPYMVRRFWRMLIDQARKIFIEARGDTERWLASVPLPLETQIRDHKVQLEARLATLTKVNERGDSIKEEIAKLHVKRADLQKQVDLITGLIQKVQSVGVSPVVTETSPGLMPTTQNDLQKTQKMQAGGF